MLKREQNLGIEVWRYFVCAVEQGSFLKAAALCKKDVSFISRQISALEHAMKEELLERSKVGVKPTWIGLKHFREAKQLISQVDAIFSGGKQMTSPLIRIGIPTSITKLFLAWLARYERLEQVTDPMFEIVQYEVNSAVQRTSFDLFVCQGELPNERLIATELGSIKRVIAASPNFLDSQGLISSPDDLQHCPLIALKSDRLILKGERGYLALNREAKIQVNSEDALIEPAIAGLGIAVGIPLWSIREELEKRTLSVVLPGWELESNTVWLLRHRQATAKPGLEGLIRFLKDQWNSTESLQSPTGIVVAPVENH